jgi:hypothetical protein
VAIMTNENIRMKWFIIECRFNNLIKLPFFL